MHLDSEAQKLHAIDGGAALYGDVVNASDG